MSQQTRHHAAMAAAVQWQQQQQAYLQQHTATAAAAAAAARQQQTAAKSASALVPVSSGADSNRAVASQGSAVAGAPTASNVAPPPAAAAAVAAAAAAAAEARARSESPARNTPSATAMLMHAGNQAAAHMRALSPAQAPVATPVAPPPGSSVHHQAIAVHPNMFNRPPMQPTQAVTPGKPPTNASAAAVAAAVTGMPLTINTSAMPPGLFQQPHPHMGYHPLGSPAGHGSPQGQQAVVRPPPPPPGATVMGAGAQPVPMHPMAAAGQPPVPMHPARVGQVMHPGMTPGMTPAQYAAAMQQHAARMSFAQPAPPPMAATGMWTGHPYMVHSPTAVHAMAAAGFNPSVLGATGAYPPGHVMAPRLGLPGAPPAGMLPPAPDAALKQPAGEAPASRRDSAASIQSDDQTLVKQRRRSDGVDFQFLPTACNVRRATSTTSGTGTEDERVTPPSAASAISPPPPRLQPPTAPRPPLGKFTGPYSQSPNNKDCKKTPSPISTTSTTSETTEEETSKDENEQVRASHA